MSGRECIDTSVLNVPNLAVERGGGGGSGNVRKIRGLRCYMWVWCVLDGGVDDGGALFLLMGAVVHDSLSGALFATHH